MKGTWPKLVVEEVLSSFQIHITLCKSNLQDLLWSLGLGKGKRGIQNDS